MRNKDFFDLIFIGAGVIIGGFIGAGFISICVELVNWWGKHGRSH